MKANLKTIQSLVGDLIWTDYDRLSDDGVKIMEELCKELSIIIGDED
jgi:hypothetical protein